MSLSFSRPAAAGAPWLMVFADKHAILVFSCTLAVDGKTIEDARVALDSGSTYSILASEVVRTRNLQPTPLEKAISVTLANGEKKSVGVGCRVDVTFAGEGKNVTRAVSMKVLDIPGFDAILGMDFLSNHRNNPVIDWTTRSIVLAGTGVPIVADIAEDKPDALRINFIT